MYVIYDPDTGMALYTVEIPNGKTCEGACVEVEALPGPLEDCAVAGDGLTLRPAPHLQWDVAAQEWIDPRTAEDVEAAAAADLQARRERASLSRAGFIKAVMHAGIVTPAEAAEVAKGNVPESLGPAFAAMTEAERAEASIDWSAAQRVDRLHPLILKLADALGVTDQDLDTLFGLD